VVQSKLEDVEKEVLELNGNNDRLARTYHELVEMQTLLDQGGKFFAQTRAEVALDSGAGTEVETMDHGAPLLETAMPVSSPFFLMYPNWTKIYPCPYLETSE
jgi:hypothetical protein